MAPHPLPAVPGLHFPLMLLVDYKGWRVICTSVLPLGKDTLRYGSADGAKYERTEEEERSGFVQKEREKGG